MAIKVSNFVRLFYYYKFQKINRLGETLFSNVPVLTRSGGIKILLPVSTTIINIDEGLLIEHEDLDKEKIKELLSSDENIELNIYRPPYSYSLEYVVYKYHTEKGWYLAERRQKNSDHSEFLEP